MITHSPPGGAAAEAVTTHIPKIGADGQMAYVSRCRAENSFPGVRGEGRG